MKSITSSEFKARTLTNPEWAGELTETLVVTDYCGMRGSIIRKLSPHLHFQGRDEAGNTACFDDCMHLEKLEGTFNGMVSCRNSGIQNADILVTRSNNRGKAADFENSSSCTHIKATVPGHINCNYCTKLETTKDIKVTSTDEDGNAASFIWCSAISMAGGNFPGYVDYKQSGITIISYLTIEKPNNKGEAANFAYCGSLAEAFGNFPGRVYFDGSAIQRINNLRIQAPDNNGDAVSFSYCANLRTATGKYPGAVDLDNSRIEEFHQFEVTQPNKQGIRIIATNCTMLKDVPASYKNSKDVILSA